MNCGLPLDGGEYVAAWEEGQSLGYVVCPHCRCPNYD